MRMFLFFELLMTLSVALAEDSVTPTPPSTAPVFPNGESYPGCGIIPDSRRRREISEFIVGGTDDIEKAHPWNAALISPNLGHFCGGTLISKTAVLTAAHCIYDDVNGTEDFTVMLGEISLNEFTASFLDKFIKSLQEKFTESFLDESTESVLVRQEGGMQIKKPARVLPHPKYNSANYEHDISLVILEDPGVTITPFVRPICLWKDGFDFQKIENKTGEVVGWGLNMDNEKPNILQMAKMRVVPHEECAAMHGPEFSKHLTPGINFCAGGNGTTPCLGDSGGGFAIALGRRWFLRGIASHVRKLFQFNIFIGCAKLYPSFFADITCDLAWIIDNTDLEKVSTE